MTILKFIETTFHQSPRYMSIATVKFGVMLVASCFFTSLSFGSLGSQLQFPQAHDEFWLVNARDIADCQTNADCTQLKCFRKINGEWCPAAFNELASAHRNDSSKETVLHVHGMRTNFDDGRRQCSTVYQNIFANCDDRPPVRFVCWLWRSETESHRPVREFKSKSRRAILLGRLFAKTLECLGDRPPILVGYSLGAQLIASAITEPTETPLPCYRFAALAPVLDCNFPKFARNPARTQQVVIFSSSQDRATRFATHICKKQQAPSFTQWACSPARPLGPVDFIDVTAFVGRKHSIDRYTNASPVSLCINRMVRENSMALAIQPQMVETMAAPQEQMPFISSEPDFPSPLEPTLLAPAD